MPQQAHVTEEQARAVAEESRESGWEKPSFARELFLGRFPLDLIHPFPKPTDAEETRTRAFLDKLRQFLRTVDGSVIEREARMPDEYVKGLAGLGCFGMKIPAEYGGLEMSQVAYNRALMMVSPIDRCARAAQARRYPGAEAKVPAALRRRRDIGVPADRTRRGLRPGAAGCHGHTGRRR